MVRGGQSARWCRRAEVLYVSSFFLSVALLSF
jgi:hypothetical protein